MAYNNDFEDGITDANHGYASSSEAMALLSGAQTRIRLMNCKKEVVSMMTDHFSVMTADCWSDWFTHHYDPFRMWPLQWATRI